MAQVVELIVAARLRRERPAIEDGAHRADRFVEPVETLAEARPEVDAVGLVLQVHPRAADAQDRPALADVVERGGRLRGQAGVAEGVGADEQAQAGLLGRHRPGGEARPAFDDGLIWVAEDGVEVVPRPEMVVAKAINALGGIEHLGPGGGLAPQQDAGLEVGHGDGTPGGEGKSLILRVPPVGHTRAPTWRPRTVYVPAHFQPTEADVVDLLTHAGAIDLVTVTSRGILATMLPIVWDAPGSRADIGPFGALRGHVARKNDQWREPVIGEAMAIVRGPDAYVTPSWYATKREHGRVVPTWNYTRVHAYGRLLHPRRSSLAGGERARPHDQVRGRPSPGVVGRRRARSRTSRASSGRSSGSSSLVDRLDAKLKLSQNRSTEDVDGVIAGLEAEGDRELAGSMRGIRER